MNKRSAVKEKYEQFLVDAFIAWWSSQTGEQFRVISRPKRPDFIVQSDQRSTWIEVTDAFYSGKWAQDLYSNATLGERHKPIGPWQHTDMDTQTALHFVVLLKKKLSKPSYAEAYNKYGSGILLINMQSPWFNDQTCDMMHDECRETDWSTDKGYFSHVFISFHSLNKQTFEKWEIGGATNSCRRRPKGCD